VLIVIKYLLLGLFAIATVGFGLCGAWGVSMDFVSFMHGCKGQYACFGWYFGLIGLGIAVVSGLLAYWLRCSIRAQNAASNDSAA
jgi:hypothetical protein